MNTKTAAKTAKPTTKADTTNTADSMFQCTIAVARTANEISAFITRNRNSTPDKIIPMDGVRFTTITVPASVLYFSSVDQTLNILPRGNSKTTVITKAQGMLARGNGKLTDPEGKLHLFARGAIAHVPIEIVTDALYRERNAYISKVDERERQLLEKIAVLKKELTALRSERDANTRKHTQKTRKAVTAYAAGARKRGRNGTVNVFND